MRFNVPIWISSPAKVKKLGVVERIIFGVFNSSGDANEALTNNDLLLGTRQLITPYNYKIVLIGNKIQVLQEVSIVDNDPTDLAPEQLDADSNLMWPAVINLYGVLRPGVSQIRLDQPDGTEIIGTIVIDPNDDRFLLFDVDVDTVPRNTLEPVNAVINPLLSGPSNGLPAAAEGQRYLLTEDTGDDSNVGPATAWLGTNGRPLIANANDIIEYQGGFWRVEFPANQQGGGQYVTNITTGVQYLWTGEYWTKSYQGVYLGGQWSLVL
jgi:hypothetical protein